MKACSFDAQRLLQSSIIIQNQDMSMKLYVGNLPFKSNEEDLRALFSQAGAVLEVSLPMDRTTGKPRGFAFVTMETREGGEKACQDFDGFAYEGRPLKVNEARPPEAKPRSFGGGGGGGGYGGGGGGGGYGGRGGGGGGRGGKPWERRGGGDRDRGDRGDRFRRGGDSR